MTDEERLLERLFGPVKEIVRRRESARAGNVVTLEEARRQLRERKEKK